ncbi:single-stranded DNA-binding protein 3-like isoform X4 [Homarus americanus]|uniref:single-stranded DNA-binding protein 3-like isoform X4 n=1 Tax=Homarus americanus TaxID=6706 RepID=UPI001C44292C|nr:single-stranded DNA-binding protein 3-like isoform X4 [Homarus americanus]
MYAKGKGSSVPSDAQAREKLALYVYEYLLHVGAQKAAQTFLSEIRWEKNITLGEPPGFLHSWWCVFWDLYCAAPERRDTCEHSSEAKAFHDYGFVNSGYGVNGIAHVSSQSCPQPVLPGNAGPAPSPLGQMPPSDGMGPGGPMPPGFFPPFMSPRYPGGPRPGVRMPQMHNDFNGPPGQPIMPNSMDPTRQGDGDFVGWQGRNSPGKFPLHQSDLGLIHLHQSELRSPPGMNPRMAGPRGPAMGPGPGMGPMGPGAYAPGMRGPPPSSMGPAGPGGPGGPGPGGPGPGMPPMTMGGPGPRQPWTPNTSTPMSYSSSSPGTYGGMMGPPGSAGPPGPGTPIMPSPQGSSGAFSPARLPPTPRPDTSSSGADGMFPMMKPVPGGGMPGDFPLGSGPDGPMGGPMGPNTMGPVMNGDGLDGMKNSPANGPGTPRDDGGGMGDYNLGGFGGPQESDLNSRESNLGII